MEGTLSNIIQALEAENDFGLSPEENCALKFLQRELQND
jgi:hypothetical protein